MAKELIVFPKGYRHKLPHAARMRRMLEIELDNVQNPIHLQILKYPHPEFELKPVQMSGVPMSYWLDFLNQFYAANADRMIAHNTYAQCHHKWEENCWENKERFLQSPPVEKACSPSAWDIAVVVGNGPSLLKNIKSFAALGSNKKRRCYIFTTWHSAPKLIAHKVHFDFMGHIDIQAPADTVAEVHFKFPEIPESVSLIAEPTVTPMFLDAYPRHRLYAYLGSEVHQHTRFARKLGIKPHNNVSGTVTNMLTQAATHMGFKHVALIGVDLGYLPDAIPEPEFIPKDCPLHMVKNGHGNTVYTHAVFLSYKTGLEVLPEMRPDVRFYNCSDIGLTLEGFEYKPLEKL